ncbi:glycogen debranching protein GlgX [Mobilicoccus caccae]|uniref:Glycogen operon protein GlgX homolog n=1 Tax=Mobilicoccus caccae TaxID=1859295 RepID=A0ABQ6IRB6_9MICO|nr:glycogen debranching protein GlgX [Mobilicoccus caccae]GMA40464.1 glycogen operon protein GlgX homolog [Mobilicoccus caccae]
MRPHRDLAPPLGAHCDDDGTTFALFASHADAVELCLFDADDAEGRSERRIPVRHRVNHVWSIHLPDVGPGQRYGYRVHGPWRPAAGLRHNPAKLLLDPYAKVIDGRVTWGPELCGHEVDDAYQGSPDVQDHRDSAHLVPRSVVVGDGFDWGTRASTRVPWNETVVYEVHVRGATLLHPGIPEELRGTYAGLAHPAFVDHLLRLGVTTVELLPVHSFTDERHLAGMGMHNYWGYNTLGFFAPHAAYAAATDPQGVVEEFKAMVRTLHEAGLEVILDVVYNHTAEQGSDGATLSWRGIDNASYYRLDDWGRDIDVTGCGNTLDLRHVAACRMTLDSLRYWATEFHIDGYRFDLAVALARGEQDDYERNHPFLMALRTDPVLSGLKLIAEPWDVGMHGWRTGQFPAPFREWNDRFRDTIRTFWLPDVATASAKGHGVRELATRLSGSEDLFGGRDDRGPTASVNYVASHDGYSLADTTAYEQKHNEPNGEGNRDGHGDNRSWNHGVEGLTDDPEVLAARRRSLRNLLATTLLATGTPMLCAGDEFGRTQRGNNNAYCQDNETSWLDWERQPSRQDLLDTTRFLLRLRREHPVLRQGSFFTSSPELGDERADVHWYGRYGEEMTAASWEDPRCRVLQMQLIGDDVGAPSLLMVLQGKATSEDVRLPPLPSAGGSYTLLWDSSWERPEDGRDVGTAPITPGTTVHLTSATLQLYEVGDEGRPDA